MPTVIDCIFFFHFFFFFFFYSIYVLIVFVNITVLNCCFLGFQTLFTFRMSRIMAKVALPSIVISTARVRNLYV